ncbi:hypothetical protein Syun_030063 [Stephania yunnanensis]|uniref:Uncharacterized protein n=1 Tax=Stephania yunnanensis TaxID=152371 RepID=A0AAP0EF36_9MAGN
MNIGRYGDQSATKDSVDLNPGIDYGVVERVVRFVKPKGKTLDSLPMSHEPIRSQTKNDFAQFQLVQRVDIIDCMNKEA